MSERPLRRESGPSMSPLQRMRESVSSKAVRTPVRLASDPSMSPSQRIRESVSSKAVGTPLIAWGIANVATAIIQMFLSPLGPYIGVNVGDLNKYFMFSLGGWIAVALFRSAAPLKLPASMVFLVLVQVWFTVSTFVSQLTLARTVEFIAPDYSLVVFLLAFIQGAMLVSMAPHLRRMLAKAVTVFCLISAFVAVLQFLNVGPAITIANIMVGTEDITNWAGQGGIRAMGIMPGIGLQITYGLLAVIFIASSLYERKLKAIEIAVIILLIGVMLMAQVRNALVLMALILIPLIVLFVRRHKNESIPYVALSVGVLALLIFAGGDRFSYMFSGDSSTFQYRTNVLWPQAFHIFQERPWFGIGVEPAFAGFGTMARDLWSDGLVMDSGYLVALSYGGLPAITCLILAVVTAIVGSVKLVFRKYAPLMERGYAIAAFAISLFFGYGMFFGNSITNISLGMLYFIIAGMAMPTPRTQRLLKSSNRGEELVREG